MELSSPQRVNRKLGTFNVVKMSFMLVDARPQVDIHATVVIKYSDGLHLLQKNWQNQPSTGVTAFLSWASTIKSDCQGVNFAFYFTNLRPSSFHVENFFKWNKTIEMKMLMKEISERQSEGTSKWK